MKDTLVCVIAHPDDEAFGPSGTLAKLAHIYDVHIVCVTDGQSDPRFHTTPGESLTKLRAEELRQSATLLGAVQVHFLHFQDGTLNNNQYHEIATKLSALCDILKPTVFMTNDLKGNSGHLDHVAVAMVTSFVYEKRTDMQGILYNCVPRAVSDVMREYFVFFPHGYDVGDVDIVVDVTDVLEKKLAAARCHQTQATDVERVTKRWLAQDKQEELFLMESRSDAFVADMKKLLGQ